MMEINLPCGQDDEVKNMLDTTMIWDPRRSWLLPRAWIKGSTKPNYGVLHAKIPRYVVYQG